MNKFSITSNQVKLLKHMDSLQRIQNGKHSPVLLHLSITNRCNQNCIHCCFAGRDKTLELDYIDIISAINKFRQFGLKSVELTGGGEPTKHRRINEVIDFINSTGLKLGMNTNALEIDHVYYWERFEWVRVALNYLDYCNDEDLIKFKDNIKELMSKTKVTACYIVPQQFGVKNLKKVIKFANELKVYTRIAPDCIQDPKDIRHSIDNIKRVIDIEKDNIYTFCSDFNVYLYENEVCMIHFIKPFLYTDGYVYCCPSSELAVENSRTMNHNLRVCHMDDILKYYNGPLHTFEHKCSYCKYALQNNLLYSLITETENNFFV